MKTLTAKTLTAAVVIGGTLFATGGTSFAAGLSNGAAVTAVGTGPTEGAAVTEATAYAQRKCQSFAVTPGSHHNQLLKAGWQSTYTGNCAIRTGGAVTAVGTGPTVEAAEKEATSRAVDKCEEETVTPGSHHNQLLKAGWQSTYTGNCAIRNGGAVTAVGTGPTVEAAEKEAGPIREINLRGVDNNVD